MKTTVRLLMLILAVGSFLPSALAGKESGGGILLSAEFATAGRRSIEILSAADPELSLKTILQAIKATRVIPVDKICHTDPVLQKEYCEDAHYDSQKNVVLFSYLKWDQIGCREKMVLSSHELLRAAGIESEDYTYSGRFIAGSLAQCDKKSATPSQRQACALHHVMLVNKFDHLCSDLTERQKSRSYQPRTLTKLHNAHFAERRTYAFEAGKGPQCDLGLVDGTNCSQVAEFTPDGIVSIAFTDIENSGTYLIRGNVVEVKLTSGDVIGTVRFELSLDGQTMTLKDHKSADGTDGWLIKGSTWKRLVLSLTRAKWLYSKSLTEWQALAASSSPWH